MIEGVGLGKGSKVLALIPARGGSKAIPHKNVVTLGGVPLIGHTIRAAQASRSITRIIVTTDDSKIAEIGTGLGAEAPFLRPAELAGDVAPTIDAVKHSLQWLEVEEGYTPDVIVLLQPTSPFRSPEDIDEAVEKLRVSDCDSVVTVTPVDHPPWWMYTLQDDRLQPLLDSEVRPARRQDFPTVYRLNGAVYATTPTTVERYGNLLGEKTGAVVMPSERSLDIDEPSDLALAEWLWERGHSKGSGRA